MSAKKTTSGLFVVLTSVLLFIAALPTPALLFRVEKPVSGATALMWGWWGILSGDFPWLANPIYFVALLFVFVGLHKTGTILAAIAIALGYTSVYAEKWWFNEASGTPIIGLGLAFYLWLTSFVVLLAGSIILQLTKKRGSPTT